MNRFKTTPRSIVRVQISNGMWRLLPALLCACAASAAGAQTAKAPTRRPEIGFAQAKQIALLVARHDQITVDDRDVVIESMDTRNERGFIPGYFSFSIIREGDSPSVADETIRMYVVSKRTADTWELNLCRHYDFPALEKAQQSVMRQTGATPAENGSMPKAIGCANQAQVQTPAVR